MAVTVGRVAVDRVLASGRTIGSCQMVVRDGRLEACSLAAASSTSARVASASSLASWAALLGLVGERNAAFSRESWHPTSHRPASSAAWILTLKSCTFALYSACRRSNSAPSSLTRKRALARARNREAAMGGVRPPGRSSPVSRPQMSPMREKCERPKCETTFQVQRAAPPPNPALPSTTQDHPQTSSGQVSDVGLS